MRALLYVLLLFIAPCATGSSVSSRQAVASVVSQLNIPISTNSLPRIAVPDIRNLDGSVTALGRLASEEILQALFQTRRCDIIERLLLDKVIKEQKLSISGILDPKSTQQLGKVLGADYVLAGSLTDLGDTYKMHIRLISTVTGVVAQSGAIEIAKDHEAEVLYERSIDKANSLFTGTVPRMRGLPQGTIFFENFAAYKAGDLLPNWGKEFMVNASDSMLQNGLSLLNGVLTSSTILQRYEFPQNFYIEAEFDLSGGGNKSEITLFASGQDAVHVELRKITGLYLNMYLAGKRMAQESIRMVGVLSTFTIRIRVSNRLCAVVVLVPSRYGDNIIRLWKGHLDSKVNAFSFKIERDRHDASHCVISNIKIVALE